MSHNVSKKCAPFYEIVCSTHFLFFAVKKELLVLQTVQQLCMAAEKWYTLAIYLMLRLL